MNYCVLRNKRRKRKTNLRIECGIFDLCKKKKTNLKCKYT
jgi:hypothetical protein